MTHPDIDASDIELSVRNGIVTMNGMVEDRHEYRFVISGKACPDPVLIIKP